MPPFHNVFLAAFILAYGLKLWLALRQMRHVYVHRDAPPAAFADRIGPEAHRKAADYTLAKTRLSIPHLVLEGALLLFFTLGGGLQWLQDRVAGLVEAPLWQGALLLVGLSVLSSLAELPLSLYRQFGIEARFGFNRQSLLGFLGDLAKQAAIGLILGVPLLLLVLWLMAAMGDLWWLWVWLAWVAFNLLVLAVYPTFIAPLFNKFQPLEDAGLKARIDGLLARTGFRSQGVFVMDGSKRSSHGNAYFTGLGKSKRIVFFDTLLGQLDPAQTEAVLAHELGHYKRRHVVKRIAFMFLASLALLLLLARLKQAGWFYAGLSVTTQTDATALALFFLVLPVFLFPVTPLMSLYSRKHEFEADAFAARYSRASDLIAALVALYRDNAATLTPDPVYSLFYDSHPKASERIARLQALGTANALHT
ncbi:M48 family peptidase [Parasulfuritortus cantonensis]|uniref:M48 family peptidase n=1 Tax=Parasulfuritortus cantonensis TaxID=2528202 RepID=A0A4R1BA64_9PROT|nr:M48 family metallopeptidase [Parasulfuritortus cantonensis]TCJ13835.1 M48 family peptidase [Parasulfuritortus cantonensis]